MSHPFDSGDFSCDSKSQKTDQGSDKFRALLTPRLTTEFQDLELAGSNSGAGYPIDSAGPRVINRKVQARPRDPLSTTFLSPRGLDFTPRKALLQMGCL